MKRWHQNGNWEVEEVDRASMKPLSDRKELTSKKGLLVIGGTTISIPLECYLYLGKDVEHVTLFSEGDRLHVLPCMPYERGSRKVDKRPKRNWVYIKLKRYEASQLVRSTFVPKLGYDRKAKLKCVTVRGAFIDLVGDRRCVT